MSPLLKKVENAGIKGIKQKRKPFHISSEDFFHETETVRKLYAELINCKEPSRIVTIPSASYGMANVINNIPFSDGNIVIADEQFPSNVYPWRQLEKRGFSIKVIGTNIIENRSKGWNERILSAIDNETRVVAIGHVHWSDGTLFDLKQIRQRLDEVGGLLIVDGTQSVGALPFDISEIRADALICSGYKWLMGPYSIGLAYYGDCFDKGTPVEENWINRNGSDDFTNLIQYEENYRSGALRYEVGEHSNFILIPMLHAALKQVLKWTPENIQSYCKNLTNEPVSELKDLGYKITEGETERGYHLFGIRVPDEINMEDLRKSLRKNKVNVSIRGDAIRVSPHLYNDQNDMNKLLRAMKEPLSK